MKAKKSLGQNFLSSKSIITDIVKAGKVKRGDAVLEIGPGKGSLTKMLLETEASVVCVEKDDRLIPELTETFHKEIMSGQLKLIHGNALELDIEKTVPEEYKVVANIPYYITGQIIRMLLESEHQPKSMTLLVQKEVAERIVAKNGKESLLSLSVKVFGSPKYIRTVGRGAFSPSPNVDSAVITIENISKDRLSGISSTDFFKILHAGFAHKRKQLFSNLSILHGKEITTSAFTKCTLDLRTRAEDVGLEKWIGLSKELK